MTSKEAVENIKDNYPLFHPMVHPTNYKLVKESYDTLEQLVDRDTPKKVCYDNLGRSECPSCDMGYLYNGSMNKNKYCGNCGQRLLW